MIIYSELLNKQFDSVDECLTAEAEFKKAEAAKDERRAELDKAYEEAIAACDRYLELAGLKVDIDFEDECGCECGCKCDEEEEDPFDFLDSVIAELKDLFE